MKYLIAAAALAMTAAGQAHAQAPARDINVGETLRGEIVADDLRDRMQTPYKRYRLHGRAGETVVIDMTSQTFDAFIVITRPGSNETIAYDDDGGGGTQSHLVFKFPDTGDYELRANAALKSALGPYTLSVAASDAAPPPAPAPSVSRPTTGGSPATAAPNQARPTPAPTPAPVRPKANPAPRRIAIGDFISNELEDGDAKDSGGDYFDAYVFKATAGQALVITMSSVDLDAYLSIKDPTGQEVADDDDSGEDGDAIVTFTPKSSGDYTIIASDSIGLEGDYDLELSVSTPKPAAPAQRSQPITPPAVKH